MSKWRRDKRYLNARKEVLKRDGYSCKICGRSEDDDVKMNTHHINHASYFKEQRFDVNNLITLCNECHINFHTNFKRSYRTKCTKYDLDNFKTLYEYISNIKNR